MMNDEEYAHQILKTFGDVKVEKQRAQNIYQNWVRINRERLKCKNPLVEDELLADLVLEHQEIIRNIDKAQMAAQLESDELWVALAPIDTRAMEGALSASRNKIVSNAQKEQAIMDLAKLNQIASAISKLPASVRGSLDSLVSEVILDLHFVIDGPDAPQSLRLGRSFIKQN